MTLTEKESRLDKIMNGINEKYKKKIVGKLSDSYVQDQIKINFIPSASPEFNNAVGGGFPIGKMTIISGSSDTGKTGLVLNTIGYNMEKNPDFVCVWLESEFSLEYDYMINTFHIDPNRFYYIPLQRDRGAEEALDDIESLVSTGSVDMCVINTLKALVPLTEIRKKMNELDVATQSRMNSKFMSKIIPLISDMKTSLVAIQQRSTNIGGYGYGDNTILVGGLRIRYQSMLTVTLRKAKLDTTDPINSNEGIKIVGRVEKNHCIPNKFPYVKFEYFALYGEGIETILSTLELAVEQGILRRGGAHIYLDNPDGGEPLYHWTSKSDFRNFMKENPTILENLMAKVQHKTEVLSDEEVAEIQKQEREEAKAAGVETVETEESVLNAEIEHTDVIE